MQGTAPLWERSPTANRAEGEAGPSRFAVRGRFHIRIQRRRRPGLLLPPFYSRGLGSG